MHAAIIPRPTACEATGASFTLGPETVITSSGEVGGAGDVLRGYLSPASGLALPPAGPRERDRIALNVDPAETGLGAEGYRLTVTGAGADLHAMTPLGLLRGIQTLRQLLPPEILAGQPVRRPWTLEGARITDRPLFSWRGAHLDVARHFFPVEYLNRYLELLALHKLNVFHLHLTDDQGWRMEIGKYPKLTEVGAWRRETMAGHPWEERYDGVPHGGFYTQDELRRVVEHAARLGITVVPEIDIPGHSQAAIASYPELGNNGASPVEVLTGWGISTGVVNVEDTTIRFFQDVLSEVMDVFPGPYIHVGGDECPTGPWRSNPRTPERMRELGLTGEGQLHSWFIRQMSDHVTGAGRRLAGWDEILDYGAPPGATVMSWRGVEPGLAAARTGHDVVMAPEEYTYFDWAQSADPAEPLAIGRPGERVTGLEKVYGYEPVPAGLAPAEAARILGTQFQLWTEYIPTEQHADYMAFPRACALAEVAWAGQAGADFGDFRGRLGTHLTRLDAMGVAYRP